MIDSAGFLAERSIRLPRIEPGQFKAQCPRCQHSRRKNRSDTPLTVTIRDDGFVVIICHHCGWSEWTQPPANGATMRPRRRPQVPPIKPQVELPPANARVYDWFARRGIGRETVDRYKITAAEKWMPQTGKDERVILFPYFRGDELVNVKYRTADKQFRLEKGAEKIFYGLPDIVGHDTVIIVEGEIDKLAFAEAGLFNVLSVPNGAPSLKPDPEEPDPENDRDGYSYVWNCKDDLAHVKRYILAVDADAKGRTLEYELARRFGRAKCSRIVWPEGCKDANDFLLNHGREKLATIWQAATPYPVKGLLAAEAYRDMVEARFMGERRMGLDIGWPQFHNVLQIDVGILIVVTGVPSAGKSLWVDDLCLNMARNHGWHGALCSFENGGDDHLERLTTKVVGKPLRQTYARHRERMTREEMHAAIDWISEHFVFIRDDEGEDAHTLDWLIERAEAAVIRYGTRVLVIDPWNEIEQKRDKGQTETDFVSEALSKLKRFARNRGCTVIVVAHPTKMRRDENGVELVPNLYDIAGSANWRNKTDIGIIINRNMDSIETEFYVAKVRWSWLGCAQKAPVSLFFDVPTERFLSEPFVLAKVADDYSYERGSPWH